VFDFFSKLKEGGVVYTALDAMLKNRTELRSFSISAKHLRMKVWYGPNSTIRTLFDFLLEADGSTFRAVKWKTCYKRIGETFQLRLDPKGDRAKRVLTRVIGNTQLPFLKKITFKDCEVVISINKC